MKRALFTRVIVGALLFVNIAILPINLKATAASPYSGKPTNIETIKNQILDALFIVKYGNKTELAFAGNYSLSQSTKDDGYESLLVSSRDYIDQCYYESISNRTLKLVIENRGKTYKGTCWGFGLEYVDMATIATPFKSPTLPLWDSYMPQPGGWLIAVYYVPGFGVTFKETEVGIVNKQTYVMGVEKFSPAPTGSALLFNQDGSFVGILTTKGVGTVPIEYFKVHGAPLQCSPASTEGNAITNCSTRKSVNESAQDGVWTIDESAVSTSNPTPSPVPTETSNPLKDAIALARESYLESLEAYRLYSVKVGECLKAFQVRSTSDRKLLSLVSGSQICKSEESVVNANYQKVLNLGKSLESTKDLDGALTLLDAFNAYVDEFNISIVAAGDGVKMADGLRSATADFEKIESRFIEINNSISNLNYILDNIPSRISEILKRDQAISGVLETFKNIQILEEQFEEVVDELDYVIVPDPFIANSLTSNFRQLLIQLPSETFFASEVNSAIDEVPNFYCQKKKKLALAKGGKCAAGFKKKAIDK